MSVETKCNCQFCNEHISFPTEMAGQTIACPHCGLETKLFVPQTPAEPKPTTPETPNPKPIVEASGESPVVAWSYVLSFLLPIAGFFFGVYLMAKKKAGHGAACMALSIVMSIVWLGIFSIKNEPQARETRVLGKFSELKTDEVLHPAQGAYGWNLGDKLPYNYEVKTDDGEITYYASGLDSNGFDGWLKLTGDRRIASITVSYFNKSDQFGEMIKVLKEKYGLRTISGNFATFGTTNQEVLFMPSTSGSSFLEYRDTELCRIAETEKENRKRAAEIEKKKQLENDLKTHL